MQLLKSAIYCSLIFSQLSEAMEHKRDGDHAIVVQPRARQRADQQRGNIYFTTYNIHLNMPIHLHLNPERSGPSFLHLALIGTAAVTLVALALKGEIEKHIAHLEDEVDLAHAKHQHEYDAGFDLGFHPCSALGINKPKSQPSIASLGKKAGADSCKLQKLLFNAQRAEAKQAQRRFNSLLKNSKNKKRH